jgi:DNA repair protein RecO (recombination protein O)
VNGAALSPAFVLHRRRYRDTSLLLELFSQRQGRVVVIAKGALSGRKNRAGLLQPFIPLLADWRGRGEIQTLTQVEQAGRGIPLQGRALYCGFYLNELLVRLSQRNDPQVTLFASYGRSLAELAAGADMDHALRRFELALLTALGLAPELTFTAEHGQSVSPTGRYRVDPLGGPRPAGTDDGRAVSGSTLLALASGEELSDTARQEGRRLLRELLAHHLGDRPLKSRELFQSLYVDKA